MRITATFHSLVVGALILTSSIMEASAVEISISSGEHEDFSRLVLHFEDRLDWQFGRVPGGFEFRSNDEDLTFQVTNIFSLIPRDRIVNIQDRGDGRLFLEVACECHADAFDLRQGEVVLDIKDGPPLSAAHIFNQNLPSIVGETEQNQVSANTENRAVEAINSGATSASVLALNTAKIPYISTESPKIHFAETPRQARQGLPLFINQEDSAISPPAPASPEVEIPTPDTEEMVQNGALEPDDQSKAVTQQHIDDATPSSERVTETKTTLLEQIGRAAAQGLLEANITETENRIQHAADPIEEARHAEPDEPETLTVTSDAPTRPETHMLITSAIDRERQALSRTITTTVDGAACIEDRFFDINTWGEDVADGAQLGNFRTGLLGEFDIPNPNAILALSRHYIYLTFGAEAAALTTTFKAAIERPDILLFLADIMDDQRSDRGGGLIKYMGCGGKVAMWAALAQDEFRPGQEINRQGVLATFSALPLHLRRHLGPALATKFIQFGDKETAQALQNAIARSGGDHGPGVALLNARIAMENNQPEHVIAVLDEVVADDSQISPKAILELITFKIDQGIEITEREISLASSHAFEQRGTKMGHSLIKAEIAALAETAHFAEAFTRLSQYVSRGDIQAPDEELLLAGLINNLTKKGSDASFLRHMVGLSPEAHLPPEIRYAATRRLTDMGFTQLARGLLNRSTQVPNKEERQLFAKIAFHEGSYDVALGYLAGLESKTALELRAQTHMGKEDYLAAAQVFARIGDIENQERSAWRAGDWQQVSRLNQGASGQASLLMIAATEADSVDMRSSETLEPSRNLLAQSVATRNVVSDLLNSFSVP